MKILNETLIQEFYGMNDAIKDIKHILEAKYHEKIENPLRTVIEYPQHEASVLYMPSADLTKEMMSMKAVTIFPHNPKKGEPTTQGIILLSDGSNGKHVALMNASYLTRLRTGALSGIATDYLSKKNSITLLMIGTGGMAFEQVLGVLAVRAISTIYLYNRTKEKAISFKTKLRDFGITDSIKIDVVESVNSILPAVDVISCSTRSNDPVFNGEMILPGTHVNGVGSYLPHMREVDFNFIKRADKIVVDDFHGATEEAGELIHANNQGDWSYDDLHGELMEMVVGEVSSREDSKEITFFKSVGAAYFDLAVALGVYQKANELGVGVMVDI